MLSVGSTPEVDPGAPPVGTGTPVSVGTPPLGTGVASVGTGTPPVWVRVTGQIVVEIGMMEVTMTVESDGQLGAPGAQLVTVISEVLYTVEVDEVTMVVGPGAVGAGVLSVGLTVSDGIPVWPGIPPDWLEPGTSVVGTGVSPGIPPDWLELGSSVGTGTGSVSVTGQTVVEIGISVVTTTVELAGQLVTSGPQLVMVIWEVL